MNVFTRFMVMENRENSIRLASAQTSQKTKLSQSLGPDGGASFERKLHTLSPKGAALRAAILPQKKTRTQSLILKFLLAIVLVCLPHQASASFHSCPLRDCEKNDLQLQHRKSKEALTLYKSTYSPVLPCEKCPEGRKPTGEKLSKREVYCLVPNCPLYTMCLDCSFKHLDLILMRCTADKQRCEMERFYTVEESNKICPTWDVNEYGHILEMDYWTEERDEWVPSSGPLQNFCKCAEAAYAKAMGNDNEMQDDQNQTQSEAVSTMGAPSTALVDDDTTVVEHVVTMAPHVTAVTPNEPAQEEMTEISATAVTDEAKSNEPAPDPKVDPRYKTDDNFPAVSTRTTSNAVWKRQCDTST